jgi:hypothetical protein
MDPAELFETAGFNWSVSHPAGRSFFTLETGRVPFRAISGVLARLGHLLAANWGPKLTDQDYVAAERHAALRGFLSSLDCLVINRPLLELTCGPVPIGMEQLRRMNECGFRLPPMLLTADPESALRFYERHDHRAVLLEPRNQPRWRLLHGPEGEAALRETVGRRPVQLLQAPRGEVLQVFALGGRAFAASLPLEDRPGADPPAPYCSVALSPALQARCCRLAQAYGWEFAQIDMVRADDETLYCLDIHAFPQYDRCEAPLQQAITTTLAELLERGHEGADR